MKTEKKVFLSCKEASFLVSLQEEKKLGVWLSLRLSFHNFSCGPCKRFALQTKEMANRIRKAVEMKTRENPFRLNHSEKIEMEAKIKQHLEIK